MSGVAVHLAEGDPDRQSAVLRSVANLRADPGPEVDVELVAHGAGVELLTGQSGLAAGVAQVVAIGVTPLACLNTLASRALTPDELFPSVGTVRPESATWHHASSTAGPTSAPDASQRPGRMP